MPARFSGLAELVRPGRRGHNELYDVLLRHAYRGLRLQFLLRAVLVAFMVTVIVTVPPATNDLAALVLVAAYVAWVLAVALWSARGGPEPVRWMWVPLLVDVAVLIGVTVIAGTYDSTSWTADVLVNGFFLVPVLAATQLRPVVCAAVVAPAAAGYFAVSVVTKAANTEPWSSILLRTAVMVGLCVGGVLLSRVQLSRVRQIMRLARDREELLDQLLGLEARERSVLAEQLHDGALQYVLAARQDVADLHAGAGPDDRALLDRVTFALGESAALLRTTVAQLHPAVLDHAGLVRALRDLCTEIAARGNLDVQLTTDDAPPPGRHDRLLYGCARELLTNVVKHAQAQHVRVVLGADGGTVRLVVADDGRGVATGTLDERVAAGHVGLAALRTRVAAAGGTLLLSGDSGTTVTVSLPAV